jgi:cobalt-zinc-cadmium efflux system membrane fusion protein
MKPSHLLLALGICAVAGCHSSDPSSAIPTPAVNGVSIRFPRNAPQLMALTIQNAGVQPSDSTRLYGHLTWNEDATVRVFTPFAGRVRRVLVDLGQPVRKGEPLAEIESADFGEAQADARSAEGESRLAESNLSRLRDLYEHGATPLKDVQAAEAEVERAASHRSRVRAQLAAYQASADTVDGLFLLRSPIAGQVVERSVTPGQEVRPDQMLANAPQLFTPLFVVSDPSRLWLEIDATEQDLGCLLPGAKFRFESGAYPGRGFAGRIDRISNSVDPQTHTIKARGVVDHADHALKAQMLVTVDVPTHSPHEIRLPAEAVLLKDDRHFVFVEGPPGTFTRREIWIGGEDESWVLVGAGIQPGERVVTEGGILLEQILD